jgi:CHAT domain-containing protein/predicted negative regulator of RcsB-dependent stress response
MAKRRGRDLNQKKSLLVLLSLVSLPGIFQRSLPVFIGILLLSKSVAATPRSMGVKIAQQPANTSQDATSAAANRAFQEGVKLYKQGTAESLLQAIIKFQEALPLYRNVGDKKLEAVTLLGIGRVYDELGQKQKALEFYDQSLPLSRQVGDKSGEAITLGSIGKIYDDLGQKQKALEFYNQSLPLSRQVGDKSGEAITLTNIGKVYSDLGEKQKALEFYNQSLPLSRQVGDKSLEAVTLSNIGLVYDNLGEKQKALEFYNQSLPLRRQVGDKSGEAITLNNIGKVYSDLGEKQKALEFYNQSLPLTRQVGDQSQEAVTLNNIGLVYSDLGEKQKALEFYNQSLPLSRQVGNKSGEATTLNNIGLVYSDLGEKQKALEFYNQSLPLSRQVGDQSGEATTLNNIGTIYDALGEKQKALEFYNQSLPLTRKLDKSWEALTLNNIGKVYSDLGEKQKALEFFNQSLPLSRQVDNKSGEALTLSNIGKVYSDLGEKQKALEFYNQSLPLTRQVGDKSQEAVTLNNIGGIYSDLGEKQKALEFYNQSLPLRQKVGDKSGEAVTLNNIGKVYSDLGEKQKALEFYNQSLPLSRQVGDKSQEAITLYNFASLERDRGNLNQSLTNIEAAINIIEELRTRITSQDLRASYFATVQNYYKFYIDLLMRLHKTNPSQGYNAKALHISERARARSLLEILSEAHANIRQGVDPKLLEQEQTLQQQLNAAEQNRVKLLNSQYTDKQLDEIKQQIETTLTQLQNIEAQIKAKSPRYAAIKYPQPLTLKEIQQQVLDDNTLLLEYSLGEKSSYLWAVTKTSITSYELPKSADIEAAAKAYYQQLTSEQIPDPEIGMKLSQMLLAPVANQLGNKRLLVVSDGALQSIPFAALPIPTSEAKELTPLLVQNEIVSLPSASTIAIIRNEVKGRSPAPKTLMAIADPVFSNKDERFHNLRQQSNNSTSNPEDLKRSASDIGIILDRLKYTRLEAETILSLVPENQRQSAFDFAASRTTATNPELAKYKIIHFATHGLVNNLHPELSGVVLSLFDEKGVDSNGFLRLNDIFNLNLPAELVVLSACQTGLGKDVKGEGLVGLTRGFMYAGAKGVVVSLWSVKDTATAELMKKFYQQMLDKKMNPVAAMRAAQLEMWKTQQWKAPYYWAAFVVQGEWK